LKVPFKHPALRHLVPLISTLAIMTVCNWAVRHYFGYSMTWVGLLADLIAASAFSYWLYYLMRRLWVFLLLQVLVLGALYIGNGIKVELLAAPILPSDINTLPVLLDVLFGWRFVAALAPLVAIGALILYGLRRDWRGIAMLAATVLPLWLCLVFLPGPLAQGLDAMFGYYPYKELGNYEERGPLLYFLNEYARQRELQGKLPTRDEVATALKRQGMAMPLPPMTLAKQRDVYVFLMEAFWDPSLIKKVEFNRDPWAAPFRALWDQTDDSWVQTPVFGGGTANSELEVLCGMPALPERIAFVTSLVQAMPCMPMLLAQAGYRTIAIAPDDYSTWNRNNSYQYLGFDRFYAKPSLFLDDQNGGFLANQTLFAQMHDRVIADAAGHPRLVYTVTTSGHYPFLMDLRKRPQVIKIKPHNEALSNYANAVYYDSQELSDYLVKLRAADPDAIIVIFGDHLPALSSRRKGFSDTGLFPKNADDLTPETMRTRQSTPLIVIDGKRGPLKLGRLSLFEVPRLLLSLLGASGPTALDAFAPPPHEHPRPIYSGRFLVTDDEGGAMFCDSGAPSAGCEQADAWEQDMQVLRTDLVSGKRFGPQLLYGDAFKLAIPDTGLAYHAPMDVHPCDIKVTLWGPPEGKSGRPFNLQKSGNSALYIQYTGSVGNVEAWLGSRRLDVTNNGQRMALSLPGQTRIYLPGTYPLTLKCNGDDTPVKVGDFHVYF